jgi:peptidoglycan/LPS O-acetylase OafA/YrhL/lysophospholipase L1-like esterase
VTHAPRLTYRPALDGLRALAVAAVLLYHLPVSWAKGGWLGVSAFFVLSGYLITSLLLVEHHGTGRVDRMAFWARRFRRLLPASLACIAMVIAFVALEWLPRTPTLRGDLLAALFDVENWRVYATGGYDALWRAPSPVAHFWSLAIEEQWYVIWPIAVALLLAWSRRAFVVAVGLGIVGAFVAGMLVSPALAYLATFTRAAELLVGAALALLLQRIRVRPSAALSIRGVGALAAVVAAFAFIPLDWSPLFQGGLLAFAVVVALLVTAAVTPGPVASVLSLSPLVWLGLRSYGVYLYHWPLYLVFENQGWSTWWALLTTLAVAEVSFRVLEQPVRTGAWPRRGQAKILAPTAVALVGVAAFVVAPVSGTADDDLQVLATATLPTSVPAPATTAADITLPSTSVVSSAATGPSTSVAPPSSAATTAAPTTVPPPPTTTLPARPVRITVVGDSTAHALGKGLTDWGSATGRATVTMRTIDGCGLIREGSIRFGPRSTELDVPSGCADWATRWPQQLSADQAELVVVTVGPWEWIPRRWSGSDGWVRPTDLAYQQKLAGELAAATDVLSAGGRKVVWVTGAPINPGWGETGSANADPSTDDAQRRATNDVLRQVATGRPNVALIDLAAWVEGNPQIATDQGLRPDGVHWTEPAAQKLVELLMQQELTPPAA